MECLLGPCTFNFNDFNLGETLKNENVNLKIVPKTEDVKTDESTEIKEVIEIGREITLEATLPFKKENFDNLGIDFNFSNLVKKGKLIVETLDKSISITMNNVSLIIETNLNFKSDKANTMKIKVKAFKDNLNKDILFKFN